MGSSEERAPGPRLGVLGMHSCMPIGFKIKSIKLSYLNCYRNLLPRHREDGDGPLLQSLKQLVGIIGTYLCYCIRLVGIIGTYLCYCIRLVGIIGTYLCYCIREQQNFDFFTLTQKSKTKFLQVKHQNCMGRG